MDRRSWIGRILTAVFSASLAPACKVHESAESIAESQGLAHGPHDEIWSSLLWGRQKVSRMCKLRFPGYSTCYRCDMPWSVVRGHLTKFSNSEACFPLCEDCWKELATADNRMPYYEELIKEWARWGNTDKAEAIRKAVRSEPSEKTHWQRVPIFHDDDQPNTHPPSTASTKRIIA